MPSATKTFRVFVSSTFSDMREERRILQQQVFPRLEKLCQENGARFQAVDLRWGVNEESQLDQKTMDICLNEIRRCQRISPKPNFIVLLGDRYGWQPVPSRIPADEMERILESGLSQGHRELLDRWYRRDDNAVPAEYVLLPRTGDFKEYVAWQPVESEIRAVLREAVDQLDFGEQFIGASQELYVVVFNTGFQPLTVTGLAVDHPDFVVDTAGATIQPGENWLIPVTYAPSGEGPAAATLTIDSDDPDEPSLGVALQGVGLIPPDVSVVPDALDVKSGCPRTPSAGAPFALPAALSKRSTLRLKISTTHRLPEASPHTPLGPCIPFWVVAGVLEVKSGCPRTPSAAAPSALLAALSKRSTRLLRKSATQSRPAASTKT